MLVVPQPHAAASPDDSSVVTRPGMAVQEVPAGGSDDKEREHTVAT